MFDPKKRNHHIQYAQNFLNNPSLARYVVGLSNITSNDSVVEIGPGKGMLTNILIKKCRHLTLVEKDRELALELRQRYAEAPTVKIIHADALQFRTEEANYKVFSNPPFNILSQVIKKFVFAKNAPQEMYLFMQKEAQQRLSGKSGENQLSILIKSFYTLKELHKFKPSDFSPVPSIDVNLIGFYSKSGNPILPVDKQEYILFVQFGFQQQKATLEKNFDKVFTHEQWKRLAKDLNFSLKSLPTDLKPDHWIGLFRFYKIGVTPEKQRIVQAFAPRK
ncbi:MAG TPA: rRNA adenine dimethyltransferase family protein [Patescibacteria group bacterium]